MRIPYFSIFMRTTLPREVHRNEISIVNLGNAEGPGTHWVAYTKRGKHAIYFHSFDNLRPPKELVRYLENNVTLIEYNRTPHQRYDQNNCVCNFYKWLTINLKTDIMLFKLSIKHVIDIYTDWQE